MKKTLSMCLTAAALLATVPAFAQGASGSAPAGTSKTGAAGGMQEPGAKTKSGGKAQAGKKADIVATATSAGNFTTLTKALQTAGLTKTLQGKGPFTVFAPTDDAFAKLPQGELDALMKDKKKLSSVLLNHVVQGKRLTSADLQKMKDGSSLKMANKDSTTLHVQGSTVQVDTATITQPDIEASNGVIHAVDTVLMPASGGMAESKSTLPSGNETGTQGGSGMNKVDEPSNKGATPGKSGGAPGHGGTAGGASGASSGTPGTQK